MKGRRNLLENTILLPDLEMTKLWYAPQAINDMGNPFKDVTSEGCGTDFTFKPNPNWPCSLLPHANRSPSEIKKKINYINKN